MRKLYELAAPAAVTDTATTQISEFSPTRWEAEVQKYGEDFRFLQQVVNVLDLGADAKDVSVRIPITTSHRSITTSHTEGDERTFTEMTNLDTVLITTAWKLGAIAISREIVNSSRVDLIALAKYMIAQDMEQDVEADIVGVIDACSPTNVVYGGAGNAAVGDLATGDVIAQKDIADAIGKIESYDFKTNGGWLFIHPLQKAALLKNANFLQAERFGARDVVLNGEIAQVHGVKIIATSNITADYGGSWGASGHNCFMLGKLPNGKAGVTLVYKTRPALSYEYLPRTCNHYIYYDAEYKSGVVQEKSLAAVRVTDA